MDTIELTINRILPGGQGMGHADGKTVLVPLTAAGDRVRVTPHRTRKRVVSAHLTEILEPGPDRIEPPCPHYGVCGGCHLMHLSPKAMHRTKESFVTDSLRRIAKIDAKELTNSVESMPESTQLWGYRSRAGFKVRRVRDRQLLGFFAHGSHKVVDLERCPILHPTLESLIAPLRETLSTLSIRDHLPQVDVCCGEEGVGAIVHVTKPPTRHDREKLLALTESFPELEIWIQRGRHHGRQRLRRGAPLTYRPVMDDGQEITLQFQPGDFTQAHFAHNRTLVRTVLEMAGSGERVLDLFCGIGNFSLPLTRRFGTVSGIESHAPLVERARNNAKRNRIGTALFTKADINKPDFEKLWKAHAHSTVVWDPPREGSTSLAKRLAATPPERSVAVSCDPATFARDCATLRAGGMRLSRVVPIDMFPHTHHVELAALFESTS
ncbi:MAG: 23S rRNA (uracil(1939)-C(5))-methyltransferase RlmD [Magnetococcales bacterium]|nr:23S rRNA (uracil(1939)-C(5))-methyltransferase RlmD [Magnetococcales bacterium]